MARFVGYESCPTCTAKGRDRSRDNLGRYSDGSGHCFSCGHHEFPTHYVKKEKEDVSADKAVLPADFTREVPATAWRWLLQYGLPYTYWKPFVGYSPQDERLVITYGNPVRFSQGRYLGTDEGEKSGGKWVRRPPRKWHFYGDGHGFVEVLGAEKGGPVVLVEDIISNHKVAQVYPSLCLFGTNVHDEAVKILMAAKRPVTLWLDADQYTLLPPKINRLQTFLKHPVRHVSTEKDPKSYDLAEIKSIVG
jgi:hypothetical protein